VILARSTGELDPAGADEQMAVGRGDIDAARCNGFALLGVGGQQRPGPAQNLREPADSVWRNVNGDQDRRREVPRKARDQGGESLDAAGGGADHDDVTLGHQSPVCLNVKMPKDQLAREISFAPDGCSNQHRVPRLSPSRIESSTLSPWRLLAITCVTTFALVTDDMAPWQRARGEECRARSDN
jgi:hypothetical protein